jgi:peptide/nickel transport system substrate-binding protein
LSGGFAVATTVSPGGYTVTVLTNKSEQLSAQFTVTGVTAPPCIIATVTFGSEAAPAVQYLRNFRDHLVLSTRAGSAFMVVFNAWYYSFSPTVAGYIAANDPLRAPIRVILYPLLGVLGVSTFTYSLFGLAPEFAIVMAGLVASSLIGLVYLTPFMLVGMRALTRRRRVSVGRVAKRSLLLLAAALALLLAGEVAGSFLLLAVASSAIVLTCIIAAPTILALVVMTRPKSR